MARELPPLYRVPTRRRRSRPSPGRRGLPDTEEEGASVVVSVPMTVHQAVRPVDPLF